MKLTLQEARRLALTSQGLLAKNPFGMGVQGTLNVIEHLSYIQIDTISVIERAHHHTLWNRVPNYDKSYLDQLGKDRKIFEYWSHAASFLPMKDYPFAIPIMKSIREKERHWYVRDQAMMNHVLQRIRLEGPLMSRNFEHQATSNAMWDWKPAKMALHELFMLGDLMVTQRINFQKVYDLPERCLPETMNTHEPNQEAFITHLIMRSIKAHGLVEPWSMIYLRKGLKKPLTQILAQLTKEKAVIPVAVDGNSYYTTQEALEKLPTQIRSPKVRFISPFDNAIIMRKRLQRLFQFDYQTEIYLPKEKRKYGYFAMPILYGDQFIGRLDPKADRKSKTLVINNLSLDLDIQSHPKLQKALANALQSFAKFNHCEQIHLNEDLPQTLIEKRSINL